MERSADRPGRIPAASSWCEPFPVLSCRMGKTRWASGPAERRVDSSQRNALEPLSRSLDNPRRQTFAVGADSLHAVRADLWLPGQTDPALAVLTVKRAFAQQQPAG